MNFPRVTELGNGRSGSYFLHQYITRLLGKHLGLCHIVEENNQGFGRYLFLLNCFFFHRKPVLRWVKVKSCAQPISQGLRLRPLSLGPDRRRCDYNQLHKHH